MLRLSKKSDYALMSMKHLATRPGDAGAASAREIAEAYSIPLDLLAKVLQQLVRQHLLVSVQGTRGGYRLARTPDTITVADIVQAMDGPFSVTACSPDDHACDQYSTCSIRDPLWKIRNRIFHTLNAVTLAELAGDAVPEPGVAPLTFVGSRPS